MSTNTEREELARVIVGAYGEDADTECPCVQDLQIADAILAAGYRKPRIITTVEELDALPLHSVVMDGTGDGVVYQKRHKAQDGIQWYEPGYVLNWGSIEITLPATVLGTPEPTA